MGVIERYVATQWLVTKHSTTVLKFGLSYDNRWILQTSTASIASHVSFKHLQLRSPPMYRLSWQAPYTTEHCQAYVRGWSWPLIGNHIQHVIKIFQALSLLTRGNNIHACEGRAGFEASSPPCVCQWMWTIARQESALVTITVLTHPPTEKVTSYTCTCYFFYHAECSWLGLPSSTC